MRSLAVLWLFVALADCGCLRRCPVTFTSVRMGNEYTCLSAHLTTFGRRREYCSGANLTADSFHEIDFKPLSNGTLRRVWVDAVPFEATDVESRLGPYVMERSGEVVPVDYKWSNPDPRMDSIVYDILLQRFVEVSGKEHHHVLCQVSDIYSCPTDSDLCSKDYLYIREPKPICVTNIIVFPSTEGKDRRISQLVDYCRQEKSGGYPVGSGYIHANQMVKYTTVKNHTFVIPVMINKRTTQNTSVDVIDDSENDEENSGDFGLIQDDYFELNISIGKNGDRSIGLVERQSGNAKLSSQYNAVICQQDVSKCALNLNIWENNQLVLSSLCSGRQSMNLSEVVCFTDSETLHPTQVQVLDATAEESQIQVSENGYYWCVSFFEPDVRSQTVLWVKNETNLMKIPVMRIRLPPFEEWMKTRPDLRRGYQNQRNRQNLKINQLEDYAMSKVNKILLEKFTSNFSNGLFGYKLKKILRDASVIIHLSNLNLNFSSSVVDSDIIYIRNPVACYGDIDSACYCYSDFNYGAHWRNCDDMDSIDGTTPSDFIDITISSDDYRNISDYFWSTSTMSTTGNNDHSLELIPIIDEINRLVDQKITVSNQSDLLWSLDNVLSKQKENVDYITPGVTITVKDVAKETVAVKVGTSRHNKVISILNSDSFSTVKQDSSNASAVIEISETFRTSEVQFVAVTAVDQFLFYKKEPEDATVINSIVVGILLQKKEDFRRYVDINFKPETEDVQENYEKICAFWDYNKGTNGGWSSKCCELLPERTIAGMDKCRCFHLTHFAQLIRPKGESIEEIHQRILTVLTYVLCSISILGLLGIGLTGALFKSWRKEFSNKVWLHLSTTVGLLILSFMLSAALHINPRKDPNLCIALGAMLHYSVLTSLAWMSASAFMTYRKMKNVVESTSTHRLLKAAAVCWLSPLLIVALLLIVDQNSYTREIECNDLPDNFCYPTGLGFWITLFVPVAAMVVFNAITFVFIVRHLLKSPLAKSHGYHKRFPKVIKVTILLFFLFGLTWIFGIFSEYIVLNYLFCCMATMQGFVMFVFIIVDNKKVRELWIPKGGSYVVNSDRTNLASSSREQKEMSFVDLKVIKEEED